MIKFVGNAELGNSTLYKLSSIQECSSWLSSLNEVNLDTETEGLFNHKNKIVMLQLNWKDITYVIDVRYVNIKPLKSKLESILVVGQNLKFDYKFLKFHGIELNNIYDTFLAECCITNGLENRILGLEGLAKKYCNINLDKSIRNQFVNLNGSPFSESQIVYGVGDVTCLNTIKSKQLQRVKELDIENWIYNEFNACLTLADIEYNGMGFNKVKWLELANKAQTNVSSYIEELDNLVRQDSKLNKFVKSYVQGNLFSEFDGFSKERDIDILWSSPTQCSKVFKELGLNLESTSERFLTKYQHYPLIKKFIDYKKEAKLVTTYGKDFIRYINKSTSRIHTSFWQIVDTSRVSSGSKNDNTPNMQNIPANIEYRNCFVAREGWKIVSCDFSGQELRLTAEGSKEPLWINSFNKGEDLHSNVASMVFNISLDKVREKPNFLRGKSYRDAAKTVNFGLVYGMSKFKLSDTLNISVNEADDIIKNYFKATNKLNKYLESCKKYGLKHGYIRSFKPYSIIRFFPKWKDNFTKEDFKDKGEIERYSTNTPIQGSGGQMVKRALYLLRTYIKANNLQEKVKIVMTVHDQIDCEVVNEFVDQWSKIQKDIMEKAGKELITSIPVLSDVTISDCWTK